jgi:hypothetical protein
LRDDINGCVLADVPRIETLANALLGLLPQERRMAIGEAAQRTAGEYPLAHTLTRTLQLYAAVVNHAVPV